MKGEQAVQAVRHFRNLLAPCGSPNLATNKREEDAHVLSGRGQVLQQRRREGRVTHAVPILGDPLRLGRKGNESALGSVDARQSTAKRGRAAPGQGGRKLL